MYSEWRLSVCLSVSNMALREKDSPPTQRHNQRGRGNKYMKYTLELTIAQQQSCNAVREAQKYWYEETSDNHVCETALIFNMFTVVCDNPLTH